MYLGNGKEPLGLETYLPKIRAGCTGPSPDGPVPFIGYGIYIINKKRGIVLTTQGRKKSCLYRI